MPDQPRAVDEPAARVSLARWRDSRLLLGLLLVLCSVLLGARLLAAADDTIPVWAVTADLGPGTSLQPDDLVARGVRLTEGADAYLSAEEPPAAGLVLTRPVGRGELLPAGAVVAGGPPDVRQVAVEVARPAGLRRGSVVDVYSVGEAQPGQVPEPARLALAGVTVAQVEEPGRVAAAGRGRGVVLLVRAADVRVLLDAQAAGRIELAQLPATPGGAVGG